MTNPDLLAIGAGVITTITAYVGLDYMSGRRYTTGPTSILISASRQIGKFFAWAKFQAEAILVIGYFVGLVATWGHSLNHLYVYDGGAYPFVVVASALLWPLYWSWWFF